MLGPDHTMQVILRAVRQVAPRNVEKPRGWDRLNSDFHLDGAGLMRVAELLEEELSISLWPSELLDLAMGGPSLSRLAELVEGKLDA